MKKIIALAVVAACSLPVFAQSSGKWYGEVAYGMVSAKDTSTDNLGTFKPSIARFTLGTVVLDNLAVDGFISQGLSTGSNSYASGAKIDIKLKTGYGIALRPFVKATEDLELFGRLGTAHNKNSWALSGNGTNSGTDSATQTFYALGASYKIDKQWAAVIDYTKFANKNDTDVSLVSLGLRFNF